ncbi:MAG: tetratricopeptide repeat protein [Gomphosphaeria aponina SAG 52.96 = DSM 107014]|uniref:Tetratricopeptide repeat protein n=1 Tax=Gomphosphaeria aponina SAG 52.96 = DSM 107014 TaxID=1521640 RepID=A0A941JRU7_9CHRO|nr:tetratricopeptide repeat protein [Gomphosphaeria aponina SAG 52.96 = DSM 107014]
MLYKIVKNLSEAIVATGKYLTHDLGYSTKIIDNKESLIQQQEKLDLIQLKIKYLQNQLSPLKIPESLQPFIKLVTRIKREKKLDYQRWSLEKQKELQLELWEGKNALQQEMAALKRQTHFKFVAAGKTLPEAPIWLLAAEILNGEQEEKTLPLEVFFAFPQLHLEYLANNPDTAKLFPELELDLAEELRQFFWEYSNVGRKIDFVTGKAVREYLGGEASIKSLFSILKHNPTLILESEVNGAYLNLRLGYWGLNWQNYKYQTVIYRLPYGEILKEIVKERANKWLKIRETFVAAGQNAANLDHVYSGDNLKNLKTVKDELKFEQAGIDISQLVIKYTINEKDLEKLCDILIVHYCIFAGIIADEYFLVTKNLTPLLPQLLPLVIENVCSQEEIIESLIVYYNKIYKNLEANRGGILPELLLDFAESLAHVPYKDWAKQEINNSLKYWLKLHNLGQPEALDELLSAVEANLVIEDYQYIEKLNKCLAIVGDERQLKVEENYYYQGVSKCDGKDYEGAIRDFNQAIALNPNWAEAYYYRGISLYCLKQYEEALADYDLALLLNNNWAEAYNNRGNTYYKLWEYEKAIADYNQALTLNPNLEIARKNRTIAEKLLENVQIKQHQNFQNKPQNLSLVNVLLGHYNVVRSLAISADGKILASSSYDYTIKIWDILTGNELHTLRGHIKDVETIAVSPDSKTIVSGSDDHNIKIWDILTGKELLTLSGHQGVVRALTITPDGKFIISGSGDKTIKIWDIITGKENKTLEGHYGLVRCLAISPDGQILASGSHDNTIKLWHLKTQENPVTLHGHTDTVNALIFSPDGLTIFSASDDQTIKQWQLNTGQLLRTLEGHSHPIYALAISNFGPTFHKKAGATLYSASGDKTIKIWQLNIGQEIATIQHDTTAVFALAIAPDGLTLVSGSGDGTIKIWH